MRPYTKRCEMSFAHMEFSSRDGKENLASLISQAFHSEYTKLLEYHNEKLLARKTSNKMVPGKRTCSKIGITEFDQTVKTERSTNIARASFW